jgi:hypothetical protein
MVGYGNLNIGPGQTCPGKFAAPGEVDGGGTSKER